MTKIGLLDLARRKSISPEDFEKRLWELSNGQERKARRYTGISTTPIRVFRARLFTNDVLPAEAREFSYPEPSKCRIGRANSANAPVFYACAGGPTTFVESRCDVGDIIVVSEFRCYTEMVVQEIGFADDCQRLTEYEAIMRELFMARGSVYYDYSSRIASHLMGADFIHGLTYPSIASESSSQNLALKTSFVDAALDFAYSTAYRIKAINEPFKYDVDEVDFATVNQGVVSWKGRKKNWRLTRKGQKLKMVSSGWNWDAFDENGLLVDPE
jgi:hypothetical protein